MLASSLISTPLTAKAQPAGKVYRIGSLVEVTPSYTAAAGAVLQNRVGDLLPRCYQNAPYQDDLGRHAASLDRFGLFDLGRLGYPEYVVRGNS
jgi:hypothetical protein